jgi:S-formylglutathione hydrolase FrmB
MSGIYSYLHILVKSHYEFRGVGAELREGSNLACRVACAGRSPGILMARAVVRDKGLKLVWFATGKDDFVVETSRATVAMLRKHGFDVACKETGGVHTWFNWREYLSEFAPLLFR